MLLSFLTFPGLLSAGRAGLAAMQLRTGLCLVRNDTFSASALEQSDAEESKNTTSSSYLDPELFVSLSQRVSWSLDRASNWSHSSNSSQQKHLGQALRQYLTLGGCGGGGGVQPEQHTNRQLLASYVAFNGLLPAASDSAGKYSVGRDATLSNPLKAVRLLRSSPHPASLFRMLNAGSQ